MVVSVLKTPTIIRVTPAAQSTSIWSRDLLAIPALEDLSLNVDGTQILQLHHQARENVWHYGAREGGRTLRMDVFLPSKHLQAPKTFPSKNPSKNLVFTENPYRHLLRTLLRSVRLHDPFGVHPRHNHAAFAPFLGQWATHGVIAALAHAIYDAESKDIVVVEVGVPTDTTPLHRETERAP